MCSVVFLFLFNFNILWWKFYAFVLGSSSVNRVFIEHWILVLLCRSFTEGTDKICSRYYFQRCWSTHLPDKNTYIRTYVRMPCRLHGHTERARREEEGALNNDKIAGTMWAVWFVARQRTNVVWNELFRRGDKGVARVRVCLYAYVCRHLCWWGKLLVT